MNDCRKTSDRILEASRKLFNEKGYTATTLAEIAGAVGIAQGNLTYHYPTKRDLVVALEKRLRQGRRVHLEGKQIGSVPDDYVGLVLSSMNHTWEYRFILRDLAQFAKNPNALQRDPDMAADHAELYDLLRRAKKEGLFRRDLAVDLRVLANSLFIVSRYWMDHLREFESLEVVTWADQERGFQHHFAVLLPYLNASARRDFESAVARASRRLAVAEGINTNG